MATWLSHSSQFTLIYCRKCGWNNNNDNDKRGTMFPRILTSVGIIILVMVVLTAFEKSTVSWSFADIVSRPWRSRRYHGLANDVIVIKWTLRLMEPIQRPLTLVQCGSAAGDHQGPFERVPCQACQGSTSQSMSQNVLVAVLHSKTELDW